MEPKPPHLSADYAAQFADPSVVAAYSNRPAYPDAVFDSLEALLPPGPSRVLELGSGTGDLTFGLAPRVAHIDAVEPSTRMLEIAQRRAGGGPTNVHWIHAFAEDYGSTELYALVVAAESIHWMEWTPVVRMVSRSLRADAMLAIVTGRSIAGLPWLDEAARIIARYSTNREYRAYDIIQELSRRDLFREIGRRPCRQLFSQSASAYVESFHSRNGFSRERMSQNDAASFDAEMRHLVFAHVPTGRVSGHVEATVIWGRPGPAVLKLL